jgi:hypothetical protein
MHVEDQYVVRTGVPQLTQLEAFVRAGQQHPFPRCHLWTWKEDLDGVTVGRQQVLIVDAHDGCRLRGVGALRAGSGAQQGSTDRESVQEPPVPRLMLARACRGVRCSVDTRMHTTPYVPS